MEHPCTFPCREITLEGLIDHNDGTRAAVITHPHPLMGGDMFNPVVDTIRKAYKDKGYTTLRFNFRGTGKSTGDHGEGVLEINDVYAARDFLKNQGMGHIELSGYSFGSWVNLMSCKGGHGFRRLSLISPPVDFIGFEDITDVEVLKFVVSGQHDTFASPFHIKKLLKKWNKNAIFIEIPDADHFYGYALGLLKKALTDQL